MSKSSPCLAVSGEKLGMPALVRKVTALGDNSVQPDAHMKPLLHYRDVFGYRRKADGFALREIFLRKSFELLAPGLKRQIYQRLAFFVDQEIENDERGRRFFAQLQNPASGGMNAHE
jgi:hypothetical protein